MAASLSPPPVSLGYLVELNLSCQGLKDADILSKSDPLVAAYIKTHHGSWSEVDQEIKYCIKTIIANLSLAPPLRIERKGLGTLLV